MLPNILVSNTLMGANLTPSGATFRLWAPMAKAVAVRGNFTGGLDYPLSPSADGYWFADVPGVKEGDQYKFYAEGAGGVGDKRDPYARSLTVDPPFPHCNCIVTRPDTFQWHDRAFTTPAFNDIVLYQLHVGAFYSVDQNGVDRRRERPGRFLDLLFRVEYLSDLGVNAVQLLPIQEFSSPRSLGYNGRDLFSPEMDYTVQPADPELPAYLAKLNQLLAAKGQAPISPGDLEYQPSQLMAVVDIFHLYGIAVILDVVYNHAGGDFDDESIYFLDRQPFGDNNRSLYFTDQGWAGGLVFAYWQREVRQFLIDNARFFIDEYHVDGFRFDEVTVIHRNGGDTFLHDITATLSSARPQAPLIAEYWDDQEWVVRGRDAGGAGFDSVLSSGLRQAVRNALGQASQGDGPLDLDSVASALSPAFGAAWRQVQNLETHDIVRIDNQSDRQPRVPRLADPSNPRSWYARSRTRVANGLLMTAPGIPMLFMGQEMMEDKYWSDSPNFFADTLVSWDGLATDTAMRDHLQFMRDLIATRLRYEALRGDAVNVYHVHNQNRVVAFHRWIEGRGGDIVVVANLTEETWWSYQLGFPHAGDWLEVFNSDVYDYWVNPAVAGNGGRITATGPALHGLGSSASIVIPANGLIIFAAA